MEIVYLTAIILFGFSIFFWVLFFNSINVAVEEGDREYMDPLPPMLKIIWPLVVLITNTILPLYSNSYLDKLEKKLQNTGVSYVLDAEQFVAIRYVGAIVTLVLGTVVTLSLQADHSGLILLTSSFVGFMFPLIWLSDARKRREIEVIRTLPVYLDFITMAVEAGLNLSGALQQAMKKGPDGALKIEFSILMRDLRSGVTRSDALQRMSDRLNIADVTSFVNSMIQAERMGASMAKTLRLQSEQRRNERFQRAEKQAMQAPVKLIFPLIVFIFPVTFMILAFPIVMKFLNQ
tara:strand:+ start:1263 stop:2135 length:873 start_codon:yes stop_codon:yes gene_type:complete